MIDEKRINVFRDYFKKKINFVNESKEQAINESVEQNPKLYWRNYCR